MLYLQQKKQTKFLIYQKKICTDQKKNNMRKYQKLLIILIIQYREIVITMNKKQNKRIEMYESAQKTEEEMEYLPLINLNNLNYEVKQKIQKLSKNNYALSNQNRLLKSKLDKMETNNFKLTQLLKSNRISFDLKIDTDVNQDFKDRRYKDISPKFSPKLTYSNILQQVCHSDQQLKAILQTLREQCKHLKDFETYKEKFQILMTAQFKDAKSKNQNKISEHSKNKIKEIHTEISEKQFKHVIADYEFEIRKLTEDQATYKYNIETEKSKSIKEYDIKISQLRKQLQQENLNWINRFDIRDKQFKNQVEIIRTKFEKQKNKKQEEMKKEIKKFKEVTENEKETAIKAIQKKLKEQIRLLQISKQKQIAQLISTHQHQIRDILAKHKDLDQKKEKEHELKMIGVLSEKKTEQKLHINTKNEMAKLKDKLFQEIHQLRKQKSQLQENIVKLNREKRDLEHNIRQHIETIRKNKQEYQQKIEELSKNHNSKQEEIRENMKKKIVEILEAQLQKTEEFGSNIQDLEQKHMQQAELYTSQIEQIKNCYEERPSKQEDLDMIKELESKLWKKQKDLQLICQELKWYQLELENKDEVYTKIFTNGNVNLNEIKFPLQKNIIHPFAKDFKFRKVAKSLLAQKEFRNVSGKVLQPNSKML